MTETTNTSPTPKEPRRSRQTEVPEESRQEILRLHAYYGTREIAPRVGFSRRVVKRILREEGRLREAAPETPLQAQSKLEPFHERIAQLVAKRLSVSRILREIRGQDPAQGYQGKRTILADYVRELRATLPQTTLHRRVKRRFETDLGEELQIDWSPYTVPIGGKPTTVHALGCLLCWSRKLYVRFYRDERQSTLLEGLASAFEYFDGCTFRWVLDNMSTAVLGRIGSKHEVLWHPRFLEFARYYGGSPFACAVRHPDRKGKKEKSFRLVQDDLLKGLEPSSWEDLDERRAVWLDHTPDAANLRVHGTTRRVPNEAFEEERPRLIRLPAQRFAVHQEGVRLVDMDSTLSIGSTRYTVPAALAGRAVSVRLYAEAFEVLDSQGRVAYSRRYVDESDRGKLVIDPTCYATLPRRPRLGSERLDEAFLRRFPVLEPLVTGLKLRFKALAPVHVAALLRLADRFGQEAFVAAATRAQDYRRFDAQAVARILDRDQPLPPDDVAPLGGAGPALLGEVDGGSLESYSDLDHSPTSSSPTPAGSDSAEGDDHGA